MLGITYSVEHYKEFERTGNKNIFEEVIDKLVSDFLPDEVKKEIESLPLEKKRTVILSTLDKDRNLFLSIKALINKQDFSRENHIKDVIRMLREYVKVGEVEKKKFGEVMSPLEIVKDMLKTLPEEVWSNPNLKWLDPANGTGPYPAMVIYKLMQGLKEWEPDDKKRYKHIVENMIYVCELQPKNMFLWLCLVDPHDEYVCNIYTGSFLESGFDKHMKDVWGVEKFDIILGNPPYNTGTSGGNGSRDLWDKFVLKSLKILNRDGYLLFVHPSKWRSPESEIFEIFKNKNLTYLEIHSDNDGQKLFGAITRYDFYCLQNSNYNGKTKVIDENGNEISINLNDWDWLPNYNYELIEPILNKNGGESCSVIYSRSFYGNDKSWMSESKTNINNLPCVYGMYKDGTCSYKYSSIDKGHFGISKVILGLGRYLYPMIDFNGEYGMMNNSFGLIIDSEEEGFNIKKAIESETFKSIVKATKWSNFQTNYKMFRSFKKDFWKNFI
jgi:hypothetical protein